jgi:hypothetical protein
MIGLVIAGPWITAVASRLFGRAAKGSSALLATRRLADNPRAAFRSVSGLVLAIFLGTMVGILAPAVNEVQSTPSAGALTNYLIGQVGLSPSAGQQLISGIDAIPGATVYPLYGAATASAGAGGTTGRSGSGAGSAGKGGTGSAAPAGNGAPTAPPPTNRKQVQYFSNQVAMSCASLRAIGALGQCAPGLTAVRTTDSSLFDDNPKFQTQPIAGSSDPAYTGDLTTLPLQAVLVRVDSPVTLERVRTYLAVHTAPQTGAGYGSSPTPPRTFGETLQIRTARASLAEKIVYAAVALTLIVAGCSLAVTVGGGLVDRKRPFTLLRVSGTSVGVLTRVVMLEAAVPLLAATVLAGGIAYGTSILAFMRLAPAGTALPQLGPDYFTIMGVGLAIAFGVILVTLPLLRRMTAPSTVRFE